MIETNEICSRDLWYIAALRSLQHVDAPSLVDPDSEGSCGAMPHGALDGPTLEGRSIFLQ